MPRRIIRAWKKVDGVARLFYSSAFTRAFFAVGGSQDELWELSLEKPTGRETVIDL